MSDDWLVDDPFGDPIDPAAAAREERRREREERRHRRDETQGEQEAPSPPPEPSARAVASGPKEDFWDEPASNDPPLPHEPASHDPSPAHEPPAGGHAGGALSAVRRHPLRVVAVIAVIVATWFLVALFQPFHGAGSGRVAVTIPKGASVAEVGDLLDREGVVASSTLFQIRVTLAGKRSDLFPGRYLLARDMSYGAAIGALSAAPAERTTTLTIPEGYSRAQAAAVAREVRLKGSYRKASANSRYLDPARYGGAAAKNLEGFLFPDTFELKAGAPVADLVQLQLQDFKRRIKGVDMRYARSKNLTTYDVLTIASMVEREAEVESERPLIAAVIYNRLHEGMPLGIDATTRFATGNYTKPLTESELAVESPYNTRTHTGLPPGPIDSPGLASIEAAAHPARVDYLYYVVKPGACGRHAFSSTEAKFNADVARYNEARESAGGESPETCGR
ncbi:MAG: endolytic transglycosylase MltG [Solirubrobacterales bacterium]